MSAGQSLVLSILIISCVAGLIYYALRLQKRAHSTSLQSDWSEFDSALQRNSIEEINRVGMKLIWNVYLTKEQLSVLSTAVDERIGQYPEFEELRLEIFNKKLNLEHNRTFL
jgi:hypothetical protein